jgi:lysozyme
MLLGAIKMSWNKQFAKTREGEVRHPNGNHKAYKCPAGYLTAGWGHNIEAHGVEDHVAEHWLETDLQTARFECEVNIKAWDDLNEARECVLIDMCFNMGWPTLSKFKNFQAALVDGDYEKAGAEMEDSRWFKQVGNRAEILQRIMVSGELE